MAKTLKQSPYTRFRNLRMVYEAEQYLSTHPANPPASAV
jgi:hypothetical protein